MLRACREGFRYGVSSIQNLDLIPVTGCVICGYQVQSIPDSEKALVRGNTTRFSEFEYQLWKCPQCLTIQNLNPVDFKDIYRNYPVNLHQRLDFFAKGRFKNLLSRLIKNGLRKNHQILDIGCGNGIFVEYLLSRGYRSTIGYDPFVKEFSTLNEDQQFDYVIANDVIEHVENPKAFLLSNVERLKSNGVLYVGTADSEDINMTDLKHELMRLHQPFHRVIFTQKSLMKMASELPECKIIDSYRRSYMDTLIPFVNYRFLDEFNAALGHQIDLAFQPDAAKILMRKPKLLFFTFFGYFFPSAAEPAVLIRKN